MTFPLVHCENPVLSLSLFYRQIILISLESTWRKTHDDISYSYFPNVAYFLSLSLSLSLFLFLSLSFSFSLSLPLSLSLSVRKMLLIPCDRYIIFIDILFFIAIKVVSSRFVNLFLDIGEGAEVRIRHRSCLSHLTNSSRTTFPSFMLKQAERFPFVFVSGAFLSLRRGNSRSFYGNAIILDPSRGISVAAYSLAIRKTRKTRELFSSTDRPAARETLH